MIADSRQEHLRRNRNALVYHSLRFHAEISACLAEYDGLDRVFLPAFPPGIPRLLTWKVWSARYRVPLRFVVSTIMDAFRTIRGPIRGRFGISIATLCGKRAEQILQEALLKTYPAGENETLWETDLENQLITAAGLSLAPPASTFQRLMDGAEGIDAAVKRYGDILRSTKRSRLKADELLHRRPWLDNLRHRL